MANFPPAKASLYRAGFRGNASFNNVDFGGGETPPAVITRTFVNLDPVASAHYALTSPIVLAGDFEIEFDYSTSSSSFQMLLGAFNTNTYYLGITSAGDLELNIGNNYINLGSVTRDGSLNTIKIKRVGAVITAYQNGLVIGSGSSSASLTFDVAGTYNFGSLFFDGILANLKITDLSGVTPVTTTFPIESTDGYELAKEATLSGELAPDSHTGWGGDALVDIYSGGDMRVESRGGNQAAKSPPIPVDIGGLYMVQVDAEFGMGAFLDLRVGNGKGRSEYFRNSNARLPYKNTLFITATSEDLYVSYYHRGDSTAGDYFTVKNTSVKKLTGNALQYINIAEEDKFTVTFDEENDRWIGENVVVNGDFDSNLTHWDIVSNSQTVEWIDGELHILTDGASSGLKQTTLQTNIPYLINFDYRAISGSLKLQVGSSSFPVDSTGSYEYEHIPENVNLYAYRNSGSGEGYFDNISLKRIINIAPQAE